LAVLLLCRKEGMGRKFLRGRGRVEEKKKEWGTPGSIVHGRVKKRKNKLPGNTLNPWDLGVS